MIDKHNRSVDVNLKAFIMQRNQNIKQEGNKNQSKTTF